MPRLRFPRLVPVLLAAALGVAACGSDDAERADAPVTLPTPTNAREPAPTVSIPTVTTPPPTTPATTPQPPPATQPASPPATQDGGVSPAQTTPRDTGGAQPPARDDPGAPQRPSQNTGGSATPADCGEAIGGFIRGIQASGGDCSIASGVANAWYEAVNQGTAPDAAIEAAGFSCSGTMSGQRTSVSCTGADGERVSFAASP